MVFTDERLTVKINSQNKLDCTVHKYKKQLNKLRKKAGMVGLKSIQTNIYVVGIITDELHPYIPFSSNRVSKKKMCMDAIYVAFCTCLCSHLTERAADLRLCTRPCI